MPNNKRARPDALITIAVCTGCREKFYPGPYFHRRIVRHLRQWWHNHDAARLTRIRRVDAQH